MLVTCSYTDCTIALKLSAIDISKNVYKMYVIISRNFGISDIRSDHLGEWGGEELCCVLISFHDLGQYLQGHMNYEVKSGRRSEMGSRFSYSRTFLGVL